MYIIEVNREFILNKIQTLILLMQHNKYVEEISGSLPLRWWWEDNYLQYNINNSILIDSIALCCIARQGFTVRRSLELKITKKKGP